MGDFLGMEWERDIEGRKSRLHQNADFAADMDTRRSHTGYIIMLNGGPVSWKSVTLETITNAQSQDTLWMMHDQGNTAIE